MQVQLKRYNGVLKIEIDGQILEPLSFKSFRPTAKNISDFAAAGCKAVQYFNQRPYQHASGAVFSLR